MLPFIGFHQQGEPYCSPIGLSFPTCIFTLFCCTIHVICFLNVLLHYERNFILLGKGFNIAVCRTVDGEVVATLKAPFIVNICECLREVEFLQLGAVTEGANASQFLEVLAEDDLLQIRAEAEGQPGASAAASAPQAQTLPASVLYFGQVTQVVRDEAGTVTRLVLSSERYGEYIMNISSDTVWIDSGNRTASDPADLKEGESVYVFHSPISTRSLPPQSAAYAVVRNIPQDISCAQYHVVEEITEGVDGGLIVTTDNG